MLGSVIMAAATIGSTLLVIGCSAETAMDAGLDGSLDLSSLDLSSLDLSSLDAQLIDAGGDDAGAIDAGVDAGPPCPALSGAFSGTVVGCAVGIVPAQVTIDVDVACEATLTSMATKALPPVNGMVTLAADGSFGPTDLTIGTAILSCTGRITTVAPPSYEIACVGGCTITLAPSP